MQRSNFTRLLPLFITLIVIALVIAAIISIGRAIFAPDDGSTEDTTQSEIGRESLLTTDQGRSVRMTVRGPIVANEAFQSYTVTASPAERRMDVYRGYLDERTGGKTFENNTPAYEQFVYALDKANMMKGENVTNEDASDDLRGICATGYVYEFSVRSNDQDVKRLWTSTCSGSKGTLQASQQQLTNLFHSQIPEVRTLIPFRQSLQLRL